MSSYAPLNEQGIPMDQTNFPPQSTSVVVVPPGSTTGVQYSQPGAPYISSTTTVVTQQPVKQPWSSGICDCFEDMYSCCCTLFFGSYHLGCVAQRMGEHCCVGCGCQGLWPMRSAFRERHHIQGDLCDDACMTMFCAPCVTCQLEREMNRLGYPKDQCC